MEEIPNAQLEVLVAPKDIPKITSLSLSQARRLEAKGEFPKRVRLGPKRIAYRMSEIQQWVTDRIADRDAELANEDKQGKPSCQIAIR